MLIPQQKIYVIKKIVLGLHTLVSVDIGYRKLLTKSSYVQYMSFPLAAYSDQICFDNIAVHQFKEVIKSRESSSISYYHVVHVDQG